MDVDDETFVEFSLPKLTTFEVEEFVSFRSRELTSEDTAFDFAETVRVDEIWLFDSTVLNALDAALLAVDVLTLVVSTATEAAVRFFAAPVGLHVIIWQKDTKSLIG